MKKLYKYTGGYHKDFYIYAEFYKTLFNSGALDGKVVYSRTEKYIPLDYSKSWALSVFKEVNINELDNKIKLEILKNL